MKLAIYDTYVRLPNGLRMHFDIVVNDELKDVDKILSFGNRYLQAKGIKSDGLTTRECRFCHTEPSSDAMEERIREDGFAIIELEHCN